jgi:purine-binding chemotaxis protein CheW
MQHEPTSALIIRLAEQRYALPSGVVERVIRAAMLTPLEGAPAIVCGVLDMAGELLPVLSLRHRFRLPQPPLRASDAFVIALTSRRRVGLLVDDIVDLIAQPERCGIVAGPLAESLAHLPGALRLPDGIVLIHDLERLLSSEEEQALQQAMAEHGNAG